MKHLLGDLKNTTSMGAKDTSPLNPTDTKMSLEVIEST
jgi:hypothetical protein